VPNVTTTTSWGVVIWLSLLLPQTPVVAPQTGPPVPAVPAAPALPPAPPPRRFTEVWRQTINAAGTLGMLVTATSVVTSDSDAGLTARTLTDGREIWTAPFPSRLAPVASGPLIVAASGGRLLALGAGDGKPRWTLEAAGDPTSLLSHGDTIIASGGSEIRAWTADGRDAWRQQVDSTIVTPAVAEGDLVFVGLESRKLVALDAKTGTHLWAIPLTTVPRSLFAARGRLYFSGEDEEFYSYLQRPSPAEWDWHYLSLAPVVGRPANDDRWLFAAFLDNTVRAFDLGIGNLRWKIQLSGRPAAGPFLAGDQIGVVTTSGTLVLIRRRDGALVPPPGSTPNPSAAAATAAVDPAAAATPAPAATPPATPTASGRRTLLTQAASADGSQVFTLIVSEDGSRSLVAYRLH
jgi:outer membrane protein assembly factor BamB